MTTPPDPTRLADVLARRHNELADSLFTQAVVSSFTTTTVTVDVNNSLLTVPKLSSYAPAAGDPVWLLGPPGSWLCVGSIGATQAGSGGGTVTAHTHPEADVTSLTTDLAGKSDTGHTHALPAHSHPESDVTNLATDLSGKVGTSDARLSDARAWSLYTPGGEVAGVVPQWDTTSGKYKPAAISTGGTTDTAVRTFLFGASGNTGPPSVEYQLTTQYTAVASGDWLIGGNMTALVAANNGMTIDTVPGWYRVTVPYAGRYAVTWQWNSSQTTGVIAGKVCKNVPNGSSGTTAATTYSILNAGTPAGTEYSSRIHESVMLAAGDTLAFAGWSSVSFNMLVTMFGGVRTRFAVRWLGPT